MSDSNVNLLQIVGTVTLFVRFGSYVVNCDFYVIERLSTTYLLGGYFCDWFVESIKARKRVVELDDCTQIRIISK